MGGLYTCDVQNTIKLCRPLQKVSGTHYHLLKSQQGYGGLIIHDDDDEDLFEEEEISEEYIESRARTPTSNQGSNYLLPRETSSLKNSDDVEAFRVKNFEWKCIPNGISVFFPNVRTFQIIGANLKVITKENFSGFQNLTILNLWNNSLRSFSDDTFDHLNNLKRLYISKNDLQFLHGNSFAKLRKLEIVDLYENELKCLPQNIFKNNLNLKRICMDHNFIGFFTPETIEHLNVSTEITVLNNTCINSNKNVGQIKHELASLCSDKNAVNHDLCPFEDGLKTEPVLTSKAHAKVDKVKFYDLPMFRLFFGHWWWFLTE